MSWTFWKEGYIKEDIQLPIGIGLDRCSVGSGIQLCVPRRAGFD